MIVDYENLTGEMIPHALRTLRPGSNGDNWEPNVRMAAMLLLRDAIIATRDEGAAGVVPDWLQYDIAHGTEA